MESDKIPMHVKIVTLIGCMCMNMPSSVEWYWGGVSVYALSYIISNQNPGSGVSAPWIISVFIMLLTTTTIVSGMLAKYVRRQLIMVAGSLIVNTAAFLSYYAIQHSLAMLVLSMGVLTGIGTGFIYGTSIHFVVQAAGKDVGLFTSTFLAAFSLGGLVIVQLITQFINPENDTPDLRLGSTIYFTQNDILDKVPSMFLILGCFTMLVHGLGFIFLQFDPNIRFINKCSTDKVTEQTNFNDENGQCTSRSPISICDELELDAGTTENQPCNSGDFTPKEILKTPTFYFLCISFSIAGLSFILVINFYKLYGQTRIHDDHFLSNLGMAFTFMTCVSRVLWGFALDKFTPKQVLFALHSSIILMSVFYYFTAIINRWVYFFATLIYGGIVGGLYSCHLGVIATIFGKTHVTTNFGLIISVFAVFNLIAPYIIDRILNNFGWFATFATAGGINILSEIICLFFIP